MSFTEGEWTTCNKGKCSCKQIMSAEYPVAQVMSGKWGDDYPSIRVFGPNSLELKAEAYMEQITYGEIPEEVAVANAQLISAAPDMYKALKLTRNNLQTLSDADLHYKKTFSANLEILNQALAKAGVEL